MKGRRLSEKKEKCYLCGAEDYTVVEAQCYLRSFPENGFQIVCCNSCDLL